jgi:hypothetical protein
MTWCGVPEIHYHNTRATFVIPAEAARFIFVFSQIPAFVCTSLFGPE